MAKYSKVQSPDKGAKLWPRYKVHLDESDMESAVYDGVIELVCPDCGMELPTEPDVTRIVCPECGTFLVVENWID